MKDKISHTTIKDFWEQGPPMGFIGEKLTYEEKRQFRYSLQDYMPDVFEFDKFAGKSVLDLGCGGGIDSAEFARNGAAVVSADFSRTAVETTRNLLREAICRQMSFRRMPPICNLRIIPLTVSIASACFIISLRWKKRSLK